MPFCTPLVLSPRLLSTSVTLQKTAPATDQSSDSQQMYVFVQNRLAVLCHSQAVRRTRIFRHSNPRLPSIALGRAAFTCSGSMFDMRGVRTWAVWADYLSTFSYPWATPPWHFAPYSQLFVLLTAAKMLMQCKIPDFSETAANSYFFNARLPSWRGCDIFHDLHRTPATKTIPEAQPHGTILINGREIVL